MTMVRAMLPMCQTQTVRVADPNIFPNKSFSVSSFRKGNEPHQARLRSNIGAWSPSSDDNADDYLEINVGDVVLICSVATQGNPYSWEWTKSYKIFFGNSHGDEMVQHVLVDVARTQFIRFQPIDYHIHNALRVEVYGTKIPQDRLLIAVKHDIQSNRRFDLEGDQIELGRGAFGKVHRGILKEMPKVEVFFKPKEERVDIKERIMVALKLLHERAGEEGKKQFFREISFMQRVGTHRNVLNMIGYWNRSEPIMLILEYISHGYLLQWLRNKRPQVKYENSNGGIIETTDHLSEGILSSNEAALANKSEDEHNLDTGKNLTSAHDFTEVTGKLDSIVMSDIFFFMAYYVTCGLLVYLCGNRAQWGGIPYPGISNRELYKLFKSGYRMDKPDICSEEL
ncbi:fibroblast growth factor receptor 2-like [Stylophora pistillata]|uniref:fibroblast growth factor receptor 2-like n=1 Tax=Stylophora pistillata TaxID=50429 RepID=UPI000C052FC0|nr:fibroblast growth factor receptor 2-like [Stylophora pistillata]